MENIKEEFKPEDNLIHPSKLEFIKTGDEKLDALFPKLSDQEQTYLELVSSENYQNLVKRIEKLTGSSVSKSDLPDMMASLFSVLKETMEIEKKHKVYLEEWAVMLPLELEEFKLASDAVSEGILKIDAKLDTPDLARALEEPENEPEAGELSQAEVSDMDALELLNVTEEDLQRRFANMLITGGSSLKLDLFHLVDDKLKQIDPRLPTFYSILSVLAELGYWVHPSGMEQHAAKNSAGGSEEVIPEGENYSIKARGLSFPFLVHEVVKGLYEYSSIAEEHQASMRQDRLETETEDFILGGYVFKTILSYLDDESHALLPLVQRKVILLSLADIRNVLARNDEGKKIMADIVKQAKDAYAEYEKQKEEYMGESIKEDNDFLKKVFRKLSDEDVASIEKAEKDAKEAEKKLREAEYERKRREEQELRVRDTQKLESVLRILSFDIEEIDDEDRIIHRSYASGIKANGENIHLSADVYGHKNKIQISGVYPRFNGQWLHVYATNKETGRQEEVKSPTIYVSLEKTPEVIARDIERRFLPAYRNKFALVQKKIKELEESKDKTLKNLRELKGLELSKWETESKQFDLHDIVDDLDAYGNVKVSEDYVSMELRSLTPELSKKILDIIRSEGEKKKKEKKDTNESLFEESNRKLSLKNISIEAAKKILDLFRGKKTIKEDNSFLKKVFHKHSPEEEKEINKVKEEVRKSSFPAWLFVAQKELAEELQKDVSDVQVADDYFDGTVTMIVDNKEYLVAEDDYKALEKAIDYVRDMIDDDPASFSIKFLKKHTYISDTDKRIMAGEEADNWMESEEISPDDENYDKKYNEKYNEFLDDLNDPIQYFVEDLRLFSLQDLFKQLFIQIDLQEAAEDAVQTDGIEHFLALYDGESIDLPSGAMAFRQN